MRIIIYARCSTDDKDQDPERQVIKCKQYCELHNHTIIDILQEHHSGDSDPFKRPIGQKILQSDPEGIIIYSMDRLTRQHPIKVIKMIQALKDRGIKIVSITEPAFNMESEFGEILLYLMSWFNNYFLKKLKRDIKSGMERAKLQGKKIGRSNVKFNKFRAAHLLFTERKSQRYVSTELGVSLATINRFKKVAGKDPGLFIKEDNVS